ncbi:hydrolase [Streptomyces sp. NRRL B-1677]|uniref:Hydrolase n=1 Tax=Streptomyces klenkii TaxID=1420899 RepID=A0A3B0BSV0_9ACTN|nr:MULTISPECIES: HAD family acid phosphatase [Streptomyces]MBF6046034.1 hydrolase [Streptomyces sp. NRRL B-1677]RKN76353.1 hydrolase [Streptomyces klenkii]
MTAPIPARRAALALAATVLATAATAATATAATAADSPAAVTTNTTASASTNANASTIAGAAAHTSGTAGLKGVDYATWQRDVQAVIDQALPYVKDRTANAHGRKQAIVLDIDNSSLETDFHWTYPTPAIKPVLDLTRYANARGAAIFFVTARPGILDGLTEHNLRNVGYPVSGLYVRHLPDLFHEVSTYKTAKRAEIENNGYTIIANIGNNNSDLVGGHAERTFKLPDYDGKLS